MIRCCFIAFYLASIVAKSQGLPSSNFDLYGQGLGIHNPGISSAFGKFPNSNFNIQMTDSCLSSVQFVLTAKAINSRTTYLWSATNTVVLQQPNSSNTSGYATGIGKFGIRLDAKSGFRRSSSVDSISVFPNPNISSDTIQTCLGQSTILSPTFTDCQLCKFEWSTGDTTPTLNANFSSSAAIGLKVTNQFGCTDSQNIYVQVTPLPSITTSIDSISICRGEAINISANSNQVSSFHWSTGYIGAVLSHTPDSTTQLNVYALNPIGCGSDTVSVYVRVFDNPQIVMPKKVWLCAEDTYTVQPIAQGAGSISYVWSNGGTTNTKILTSGNYTEYLTVTDDNGCSTIDSIVVGRNDFELQIDQLQTLCDKDTAAIQVQILSGSSYQIQWIYDGDSLFKTTELDAISFFKPLKSDTLYGFALSDSGCVNILKQYIKVNNLPENELVSLNDSYSNIDTIRFQSSLRKSNYVYSTHINNQLYTNKLDTIWLPKDTGNYKVDLITIDTNGCTHTYSKMVSVKSFGLRDVNDILYPNPTNSAITLSLKTSKDTEYTILIIDNGGRIVHLKTHQSKSQREFIEIDIRNLPSGTYNVRVNEGTSLIYFGTFVKSS